MKLNREATFFQMAKQKKHVSDICVQTGLSRTAVSRALNGLTAPHAKTLGLIAEALDVDLKEILEKEEK